MEQECKGGLNGVWDLRSDTVTWPTPSMKRAMVEAALGDDVYGEDPTVNALEKAAAAIVGKEAALFTPSGTQANLLAVLTHCPRGTEAIIGDLSHIFYDETAGMAHVGGVMPRTVPVQPDGTLKLEDIKLAIRSVNDHYPTTTLVCIENTQNRAGGKVLSVEYTKSVAELARSNNLKFHIDGARLFHAAAELNIDVKELVQPADSVMFCLSKGLCAPVGSILAGSAEFIKRAHRTRKMLGGGMRQAGVLAAAGMIALTEMPATLKTAHKNARELARLLGDVPSLKNITQDTNFVMFTLADDAKLSTEELVAKLNEQNIKVGGPSENGRWRLVSHYYISAEAVPIIANAFRTLLA